MTDTRTLYDDDFVAWSKQQAAALRTAAHAGSNLQLDWENLAEEVESLGASERRALHNQVERVIRHLLKLQHSPAIEPRRGWVETVNDARSEIELVLEMSPSLRNELGAVITAEQARGSRSAVRDLEKIRRDRLCGNFANPRRPIHPRPGSRGLVSAGTDNWVRRQWLAPPTSDQLT